MEYGLNRVNLKPTRLFTQVGWLGGKRIELHP
jgi:hypothetical protein